MDDSNQDDDRHGLTRADLLKTGAVGAGAVVFGARAEQAAARTRPEAPRPPARKVAGMNIVVFLTDQQRAVQHFPAGWTERNMPGLHRLQQHGLTFENAFTSACMCSPARSTLMSGYFPAQHGVKYTLETNMPSPQYPQVELSTSLKNPASVVASAGYTPVYKGKFPLRQARQRLDLRPRGRQPIWLHALGPAGRGRQTRAPRRRAAARMTTTVAS